MEINKILELFSNKIKLEEVDLESKASYKVGPIKVHFRKFKVDEHTYLSILEGKGMLGLIKLNTVIFSSASKNMPLFSYDMMHMMGKKYYLYEVYDTLVDEKKDYSEYISKCEDVKDIPNYETSPSEMDKYLLPCSVRKLARNKSDLSLLEEQTSRYFNLIINEYFSSNDADVEKKIQINQDYVTGLLNHGGASTNLFIKKLGKKTTTDIYEHILFNTKD